MNLKSACIAIILIASFSLVSCVGPQLVAPTQEKVTMDTQVKEDPYNGTWQIYTPKYYGGYGSGWHLFLRAGGRGKVPEYFQIYVTTSRTNWLFLEKAIDIDGNHLPLRKISTDVTASSYGASVHEDVAIDVSWSYLKAHREKQIKIKLYGSQGTLEIFMDPMIPAGFLDAVDKYLEIE